MNNIAKFEETKKALEDFKQSTAYLQEDAEQKERKKGFRSKVTQKAFLKALVTKQITIDYKKALVTFESSTLGKYVQSVWVRKRRVNVLPLCFLLQMYKEEIAKAGIKEAERIQIPFELRGFWKMERAIDFVNELDKLQRESIRTIQRQIGYNRKNEECVKNLTKISSLIEAIEISTPKSGCMHVRVKGNEVVFKVNMKNTKLDVVPLCKVVTNYYVKVVNAIELYAESGLNWCGGTYKMREIEEKFRDLMEKYFIVKLCC